MKKKRKKTPLKITPIRKKRGTRRKTIAFKKGKHNIEKIEQSIDAFDFSTYKSLYYKHHPRRPDGITVIITVAGKRGKEYNYTHQSDPTKIIYFKTLKEEVQIALNDLQSNWDTLDDMDPDENDERDANDIYAENLDPSKISHVSIAFFWVGLS